MYAEERGAFRHRARALAPSVLHADLTRRVLRAFHDVHWELGCGFLEQVYVRALSVAFSDAGLGYERELMIPVLFRSRPIAQFRADFLVERRVLVEVKAQRDIEPAHVAQLLNYLRATEVEVGLLLNFAVRPQFRRLVFDSARKTLRVPPRTSAAPDAVRDRGEA
jgi:GxxExxY protein